MVTKSRNSQIWQVNILCILWQHELEFPEQQVTYEVLSAIIYTIQQTYFSLHLLTPSNADNRLSTVIFPTLLVSDRISIILPKLNLRVP